MKPCLSPLIILNYIICYALFFCTITAYSSDRSTDSLALVTLYKATGGDAWIQQSGWLTEPLDNWYGIGLNETNSRVVSIHLSGNDLTGDLPPELGHLTQLTTLIIADNAINSIPETIGQLVHLEILDVSTNRLDHIPTKIDQLISLLHLELEGNELTAIPITIGQLSNLTYLSLNNNYITTIPPELGQLSNLNKLFLANNDLSFIPRTLGQLSSLNELNINVNYLTDLPPEFGQLTNLLQLNIANNNFDVLPTPVFQLHQLQELNSSHNQLSTLSEDIGSLNNLNTLFIRNNQLTTLPENMFLLQMLTILDASNNKLTNLPPSLSSRSNLTHLDLSYNNVTQLTSIIDNCKKLQYLKMDYNQLTGAIPASIGQLSELVELNLSNNQLDAPIPIEIGNFNNLLFINLENNQITGEIPPEIGQLEQLENLFLGHNQLTGHIPKKLGRFKQVQCIYVNDNELSGPVPEEVLVVNQTLGIQNNHFNFEGLEVVAPQISATIYATYAPQKPIPITNNEDILSVSAGGTLSNNTYKWYKNDTLITTLFGDSTYIVTESGSYHCEITNSIIADSSREERNLVLISDHIFVNKQNTDPPELVIISSKDTVCAQDPIPFTIVHTGPKLSYYWHINNVLVHQGASYEITFPSHPATYEVKVSTSELNPPNNGNDIDNYFFLDETKPIFIHPTPTVQFDYIHKSPNTISLLNYSSSKKESLSYTWDFGDGNFSSQKHPIHQYQTLIAADYEVCLTVTYVCEPVTKCQIIPVEQKNGVVGAEVSNH